MDRLASCYFCGVAVEAPLEEYPVVPRDLRPDVDEQSTVVLCPSCRRKLSTVVERVVAATSDAAQMELTTATAGLDGDHSGPTVDAVADVDIDRPDLLDFEGDDEVDVSAVSEPDERDGADGDDRPEPDAETTQAHSDRASADRQGGDTDRRNDERNGTPTEEGGAGSRDQPRAAASPGQGGGSQTADTTGQADGTSDGQPATGADAGGAEDASAKRDFSTSSYNRIVRLLQNREFPVAAEEIQTVAANAYGIGRRESAAVLGELVDRGILTRDGGQLYKTED